MIKNILRKNNSMKINSIVIAIIILLAAMTSMITILTTTVAANEPSRVWEWAVNPSGTSRMDKGTRVAVDTNGNIYVTGALTGTRTFGATTLTSYGSEDVFVAKMTADGNWLWAKHAGGTSHEVGHDVTVDTDGNVYITGYFSDTATFGDTTLTAHASDLFVAKLSTDGVWQWAESATTVELRMFLGEGIAVNNDGSVVVTGVFLDTIIFGDTNITVTSNGDWDIFVAKISADGIWQWAENAGGSGRDHGHDIATDAFGNAYVTGDYMHTAMFGAHELTSEGGSDVFVAKIDSTGVWQWAVSAGGTSWEYGYGIAGDASGNTYITGDFRETASFGNTTLTAAYNASSSWNYSDVFVAKLSNDGVWQWAERAGGTDYDSGRDISMDAEGNIYVTGIIRSDDALFGATTLSCEGSDDLFVAKLSNDGVWQWAEQAGGPEYYDRGYGIAVDNNGAIYTTGMFYKSITFGDITLTAYANDIFVAKLRESIDETTPCQPEMYLPTDQVTMNVWQFPDDWDSVFKIELEGITGDFDVQNGYYSGWCVEYGESIPNNMDINVILRSSYDDELPDYLHHENWSKVNYILNHKNGTRVDVQRAIFYFLNFGDWEWDTQWGPMSGNVTNETWSMINDTKDNVEGWCPDPDGVIAVIADQGADRLYQLTIIEVPLDEIPSCEPEIDLPPDMVDMVVWEFPDDPEYSDGTFKIQLSGISEGFDVQNGFYSGWCVEYGKSIPNNIDINVTLRSSYDDELPDYLHHENWSKVNYILNHKNGTQVDVQRAIFYFVNFGPWEWDREWGSMSGNVTNETWSMINDAKNNSEGWCPGCDDIIAVICDPGIQQGFQITFIEVTLCEDFICEPIIIKTIGDPKLVITEGEEYCITSETEIIIETLNQGCCEKTPDTLKYRIYFNNEWTNWMVYTGPITFLENCTHLLEIQASNCLGTVVNETMIFHVDNTPPILHKTVGYPSFYLGADPFGNDVWYVFPQTKITYTAEDTGCCPCPESFIFYRYWFLGRWTNWTMYKEPISFNRGCLHYLEAYTVDCLGNIGSIDNQTFIVHVPDGYEDPRISFETPLQGETYCDHILNVILNVSDNQTPTHELFVELWIPEGRRGAPRLYYPTTYNPADGFFHAFIDIFKYQDGAEITLEAYVLDEDGNYVFAIPVTFTVCSKTGYDQWMPLGWESLTIPPGEIGCSDLVEDVLASINEKYDWVFYRDSVTGIWYSFEYGAGGNDLETMKAGEEYWIHTTNASRFYTDSTEPDITILSPEHEAVLNILSETSGISYDDETGIDSVSVVIEDISANHFWDGTSWQPYSTDLPCVGTESWVFDTSMVEFINGHHYMITATATDNAGCMAMDMVTFLWDVNPPLITILDPIDGEQRFEGPITIELEVIDLECYVIEVFVAIHDETTNLYFDGFVWQADLIWLEAIHDIDDFWYYPTQDIWPGEYDHTFQVIALAYDCIGNMATKTSNFTIIEPESPCEPYFRLEKTVWRDFGEFGWWDFYTEADFGDIVRFNITIQIPEDACELTNGSLDDHLPVDLQYIPSSTDIKFFWGGELYYHKSGEDCDPELIQEDDINILRWSSQQGYGESIPPDSLIYLEFEAEVIGCSPTLMNKVNATAYYNDYEYIQDDGSAQVWVYCEQGRIEGKVFLYESVMHPVFVYLTDSWPPVTILDTKVFIEYPISYTFDQLSDGTYYVGAFMDSNQNLQLDPWELRGYAINKTWYADPILVSSGPVIGCDITLVGPNPSIQFWKSVWDGETWVDGNPEPIVEVNVGDIVRYNITGYNDGNVVLTGGELHDILPQGLSYIENSTTLYVEFENGTQWFFDYTTPETQPEITINQDGTTNVSWQYWKTKPLPPGTAYIEYHVIVMQCNQTPYVNSAVFDVYYYTTHLHAEDEAWVHAICINNPPHEPSNPYPASGAINVDIEVILSWVGGDPDGDTVTYDIYFGTTSDPPLIMNNQSDTVCDPGVLQYENTYYWKIVAWDNHGASTAGQLWSFTTTEIPSGYNPPVVEIFTPENGSVFNYSFYGGLTIEGIAYDQDTFVDEVTIALYYLDNITRVYFDTFNYTWEPTEHYFTAFTIDGSGIPSDPLQWQGLPEPWFPYENIMYYIHAKAYDHDPVPLMGEDTIYFWYPEKPSENNPPFTPHSPNPADGAINVPLGDEVLFWYGGDPDEGDEVWYHIYLGTDPIPPFRTTIGPYAHDTNPFGINFGVPMTPETTYYWKIVAEDNHGAITEGSLWSFTTEPQPAGPVYNINSDKYFQSIQAVIDDSDTLDGHTIFVSTATFHENINVYKQLTLQAASTPVIDAMGVIGFVINAENVVIDGFTIINATDGIVCNAAAFTIKNNNIFATNNGISFSVHDRGIAWIGDEQLIIGPTQILFNEMTVGNNGIYLSANNWGNNMHGTAIMQVGAFVIHGNTITAQKYGIDAYGMKWWGNNMAGDAVFSFAGVQVTNNTITAGLSGTGDGIEWDDFYFFGQQMSDTALFVLGDIQFNNNTINSSGTGLEIYNVERFGGNMQGDACFLWNGNFEIINNNIMSSNSRGLRVDYFRRFGNLMNDTSTFTMNDIIISDNVVVAETNDAARIDRFRDFGYDMGESASFTMGSICINYNTFITNDDNSYGVNFYEFNSFGRYMYHASTMNMGNIEIKDNTIMGGAKGWEDFNLYYFGAHMYDDTSFTMQNIEITANTINALGTALEIDEINEIGYKLYQNATCTAGNIIISDNILTSIYGTALEAYDLGDNGYYLYDDSSVILGDILINNNIAESQDFGIWVKWFTNIGKDLYNSASCIIGDVKFSGNQLTGSNYGINITNAYHWGYDVFDAATFTRGEFTISDNQITNCNYGLVLLNEENVTVTGNSIENCFHGIYITENDSLLYNNYLNNTNNAFDSGNNAWNITPLLGTNIIGGDWLGGNYWSDYSGVDTDGDGLGDTPYLISGGSNQDYHPLVLVGASEIWTIDDLYSIRNNPNGNYILMKELDFQNNDDYVDWMASKEENITGQGWLPISSSSNPFTGSFDGQGYTISNLFIDQNDMNYIGLFGYTGIDAIVGNIGLIDVDVTGKWNVGALMGRNGGSVFNCYTTGIVKGDSSVGGVIGHNNGSISHCYSTSDINGSWFIGGLIGYNLDSISQCYSTGDVKGNVHVGGLVGFNEGIVSDCYAHGSVIRKSVSIYNYYIGSFCGYNLEGSIINCFNTGSVYYEDETDPEDKGFVGGENNGLYNNNFFDSEESNQATGIGATAKTTEEMKDIDTFSAWDIAYGYTNLNVGYPYLGWQDDDETYTWLIYSESETGPVQNIDTGEYFGTIQAAINDPDTLANHTITVAAGIYYETVFLYKSLTLIGEDRNTTVVDGSGGVAFNVYDADGVTISGFSINNSHGGIYLLGPSKNHVILGNTIVNTTYGIYLESSIENIIMGNSIVNTSIILDEFSNENMIKGNDVSTGGIHLLESSDNTIENNTVYGDEEGITLQMSCTSNMVRGNIISNTTNGIFVYDSSYNTIEGNTIKNNEYGIQLFTDNHYTMITGNIIVNNTWGIYLSEAYNTTINNNIITENSGYGIYMISSDYNLITSNIINKNMNHAMIIDNSKENIVSFNNITENNQNGLMLWTATKNNISNNDISNNDDYGLYLYSSSDFNTVKNNIIVDNNVGDIAFLIQNSNNNLMYNNYLNNSNNAADDGVNTWNTAKTLGTNIIGGDWLGGNYWSDYPGVDTNGDGLGDTPYSIPGGSNQDTYPLIN